MAAGGNNSARAIAKEDPLFSDHPHFDFQWLRREGLKHIGELSGNIWTDHNAHDPGITLLEALCYALIDLGYRTTLPLTDLLATPQDQPVPSSQDSVGPRHDNFFTPLEILSCNPTTELDFRKLLLDLPGVRNAWLEPENVEVFELSSSHLSDSGESSNKLFLNGCYRVLIEPEADVDNKQLTTAVTNWLCAHRNLCEDMNSLVVLEPCELGICAEVELEAGVEANVTYEAILRAVMEYISPELRYYSLKELLDKGRSIEEIIAGRPFNHSLEPMTSAGFVDTEELLALPYRYELYGSDLCASILRIDGVIAVRALSFILPDCAVTPDQDQAGMLCEVCIRPGHVARFSLDATCIQLQTSQGVLNLDKGRIHRRLIHGGKPSRGLDQLDLPVPQGRYRPELTDYLSVQSDLPLVYGVGAAGLPRSASLERKVQALQLKGYLLFYDQLLANYLAQLGNFTQLFSLRQESKRAEVHRQSYFSQVVESMSDQDKLSVKEAVGGLDDGQILALPVANNEMLSEKLSELKLSLLAELRISGSTEAASGDLPHLTDPSQAQLELRIRQMTRDFQQSAFSTELLRDASGHLFILRGNRVCNSLLISFRRYPSREAAREAAHFTAFLAGFENYYVRRAFPDGGPAGKVAYQFDLAYDPTAYSAYLNHLVETPELYLERRDAFLNHLLARFATQFTDYAMLRFGSELSNAKQNAQTVEDKSRYLSQIDLLTRDRGRAYNYLQSSWGTDNVSGFEKRVSLLAGMPSYQRRYLNKFEVEQRFRIEFTHPQGQRWFSSIDSFATREQFADARNRMIEQLADPQNYVELSKRYREFDPQGVRQIFSRVATAANLEPSRYVYALILRDVADIVDISSKQDYVSDKTAWNGLNKFIGEIKRNHAMALVEINSKTPLQIDGQPIHLYYDQEQMQCIVDPIITYKWHRNFSHTANPVSADGVFTSREAAFSDFVQNGDYGELIAQKQDAVLWVLKTSPKFPQLESLHAFNHRTEAEHAWRRCRSDGKLEQRYQRTAIPGKSATRITLHSEDGFALASAELNGCDKANAEQFIEACQQAFSDNEARPEFDILDRAYGWRVAVEEESSEAPVAIMKSTLLYRAIPEALQALVHALGVARKADNYLEAGSEENPDFRIFLRVKGGPFLGVTRRFADADERKAQVKIIREKMQGYETPFEIREEPRRYRWTLTREASVLMQSAAGENFNNEAAARQDFERSLLRLREVDPAAEPVRLLYTIATLESEDKFRFVYPLYGTEGDEPLVLKSEQEFSHDEVSDRYSEFVSALPNMELKELDGVACVTLPETQSEINAVLIDDNEHRRDQIEKFLAYRRDVLSDPTAESSSPNWIYRVLDRDNPIAKSCEEFNNRQAAESDRETLCDYPAWDLRHDILRVICPNPKEKLHHFALYLGSRDEHDKLRPTLISHMGYETEEAARNAGQKHWLKLIELATDPDNYGADRIIVDREVYSNSSGDDCDRAATHLAVKPTAITIENATELARHYPFRNSYKKDQQGKLTPDIIGVHFQGNDPNSKRRLWRSSEDFASFQLAQEAYQLFLTLLKYTDSCRVVCEEGVFRYHLVEILAESSSEYQEEAEAWGDFPPQTGDESEGGLCNVTGVRQFAQSATTATAFVSQHEGDCYRFMVVETGYRLARPTREYFSPQERDEDIESLGEWSTELLNRLCTPISDETAAGVSPLTIKAETVAVEAQSTQYVIHVSLGNGYVLQSLQTFNKEPDVHALEAAYRWIWLATDKRNLRSDSEQGNWQLFDPFADQFIASIHRQATDQSAEVTDTVDRDELAECARSYPVFEREDRYFFRLYHPKSSALWDETFGSFCSPFYRSASSSSSENQNRTYMLESCESYATRVESERAFCRLLELLSDTNNFNEEQDAAIGTYSFTVIDPARELASHPHCHPNRASARRAEQRTQACMQDEGMHLVEHLLLRPKNQGDCQLPSCPEEECLLEWQQPVDLNDPCENQDQASAAGSRQTYVPGLDPYSFWATLILPSWTERFRNSNSRQVFRQMSHREAPALVGLNIVWLGPRQMAEFEQAFKPWLDSLRQPDVLCPGESGPERACDMVEQIAGLRNEPVCTDATTTGEQCRCDSEPGELALDDCIQAPDNLFWGRIEEQDASRSPVNPESVRDGEADSRESL